ncbi:hypothetical protein [Psychrobacter jeotgali]|uniref:hypothetical protein n=1 Tax=Psychrobacter jeotgali TaxID=179010 RepID=UPI001918CF0C|nr:hypothetical protein [Psychrobacter jeotgali]
MSVSASIDISLSEENIDPVTVFRYLLNHGWRIEDNGNKVFLPLHDDDMFDWQSSTDIEDCEIFNILIRKNNFKETLGVSLSWLDTNVGGEFLIDQDLMISISLSNNRQINSYGMTDFDWYLSKIIPVFKKEKINIESIDFSQFS